MLHLPAFAHHHQVQTGVEECKHRGSGQLVPHLLRYDVHSTWRGGSRRPSLTHDTCERLDPTERPCGGGGAVSEARVVPQASGAVWEQV